MKTDRPRVLRDRSERLSVRAGCRRWPRDGPTWEGGRYGAFVTRSPANGGGARRNHVLPRCRLYRRQHSRASVYRRYRAHSDTRELAPTNWRSGNAVCAHLRRHAVGLPARRSVPENARGHQPRGPRRQPAGHAPGRSGVRVRDRITSQRTSARSHRHDRRPRWRYSAKRHRRQRPGTNRHRPRRSARGGHGVCAQSRRRPRHRRGAPGADGHPDTARRQHSDVPPGPDTAVRRGGSERHSGGRDGLYRSEQRPVRLTCC